MVEVSFTQPHQKIYKYFFDSTRLSTFAQSSLSKITHLLLFVCFLIVPRSQRQFFLAKSHYNECSGWWIYAAVMFHPARFHGLEEPRCRKFGSITSLSRKKSYLKNFIGLEQDNYVFCDGDNLYIIRDLSF